MFILPPVFAYSDRELIKIDFKRFQTLYAVNPEYWQLDTDGIPVYNNFKGNKYLFKFNILDYHKYQNYARKIKRIDNSKRIVEHSLKAFKQIGEDIKHKQLKNEAEVRKQLEKCYPSSEYEIVFLDDINRAVVVNKIKVQEEDVKN